MASDVTEIKRWAPGASKCSEQPNGHMHEQEGFSVAWARAAAQDLEPPRCPLAQKNTLPYPASKVDVTSLAFTSQLRGVQGARSTHGHQAGPSGLLLQLILQGHPGGAWVYLRRAKSGHFRF